LCTNTKLKKVGKRGGILWVIKGGGTDSVQAKIARRFFWQSINNEINEKIKSTMYRSKTNVSIKFGER
jgi:hypothetical protein